MTKSPAFQFYPNDFEGDPDVQLLNNEQVGAYLWLLCAAWKQPDPGVLPDDDTKLAKWSKTGKRWPKLRDGILACFKRLPDGRYVQKRLAVEHAKQQAKRQERQDAGARGAKIRWDKVRAQLMAESSIADSSAMAQLSAPDGSAIDLPMANDASSSSSSSSTAEQDREHEHPRARVIGAIPGQGEGFLDFWTSKTGILMPDAMTLLEARRRIEAYAEAHGQQFKPTAERALAEFRAEVESWSSPQALTPHLFLRKWEQIQARMSGSVPSAKIEPVKTKYRGPTAPVAALVVGGERDLT